MSEKILVTQALDERDLLVKKIADKIMGGYFSAEVNHDMPQLAKAR